MTTTGTINTTPSQTVDLTAGPTTPAPPPVQRRRRVRTRYVVDWRAQFRGSLLSIVIVFCLLVLVNLMFYHLTRVTTAEQVADAPQLEQTLLEGDARKRAVTLVLSAFFLVGFSVLRTLETHKTVGAAYNLTRKLSQLEQGHYNVVARLRRGDDLKELAAGVTQVAAALQVATRRRITLLEKIAARADELGGPGAELAVDVRAFVAQEQRHLE